MVVPRTYAEHTSRRVLTTQWLEGEKLSQSQADDVGKLVNVSCEARHGWWLCRFAQQGVCNGVVA